MPTYKLQYFDVRGRGELCRYVFHAAGVHFEDERVNRETWQSVKPSTPFGQMPVLYVDDKKLAQSNSITRFLAREFGLAGKNNWEQALVDQFMELAEDMFREMFKAFSEKDKEKKKTLLDVCLSKFCELFEKALDQNGGKYFVGNDLTLADLAVFSAFDTAVMKNTKLMDSFPKLKAHRARISAIPNLASHIENRKCTEF